MKFDIHYLFTAKYAKWIIIFLVSLFVLLTLFEYATLFFPLPSPPTSSTSVSSPPSKAKKETFNAILNSSLFGVYVPENLNEDNVKKSGLNVALVGILLGDKLEDSQVIIRSVNGDEKTYKVGDKLPGDAVIKRIMSEGILVERNGSLESLSLPKNELIFEPVAKPLKGE